MKKPRRFPGGAKLGAVSRVSAPYQFTCVRTTKNVGCVPVTHGWL